MNRPYSPFTRIIILLGPPGSGKGSQAALLQKKLKLAHISTGDLLRSSIKEGSQIGKSIETYISRGQLVPDKLIFDLLFKKIGNQKSKNGYMLDGFPRNLNQAKELQKKLQGNAVTVIHLQVPDDTVIKRITQRQICTSCQSPFHLLYSPPKIPGVCDWCNSELYQRQDDNEKIIKNRLKVYYEKTQPLINHYKKLQVLREIDSSRTKEDISSDIINLLK